MDLYKYICRNVVIPMWARWERSPYLKHMEYLERSQYFPIERIREIQLEKIRDLFEHACTRSPFYRNKFREAGIKPADIRSLDDFRTVPLLTKNEVYHSMEDILVPDVDRYTSFLTSGSTGRPLKGFWNKECSEFKRACGRRSELWSGYRLGERIYCLYGNPEKEKTGMSKIKSKLRRKLLLRLEILDMLKLTDTSMRVFAEKMLKKPPSLLWGHAHGLYLLARFLEKEGIDGIQPKGMYSAGMVLHSWERDKVQQVFNCPLQDRYGCEELGLIATECKEQRGLHINTDSHYVEFLKADGSPAGPGESGVIVVTDLWNRVMPFIRYRLEDICVPSGEVCTCGRTQPLIESIQGRVADFLVTPEGELVSGISLTDHFTGQVPGVEQMQIIQERKEQLILNIVKSPNYGPESEEVINRLIRDFFGEKMTADYVFLDKIPQEATGKYRFTISRIDHELF